MTDVENTTGPEHLAIPPSREKPMVISRSDYVLGRAFRLLAAPNALDDRGTHVRFASVEYDLCLNIGRVKQPDADANNPPQKTPVLTRQEFDQWYFAEFAANRSTKELIFHSVQAYRRLVKGGLILEPEYRHWSLDAPKPTYP